MENRNESLSVPNEGRWTQLHIIGKAAATEARLKGDYLTDCAMDFVIKASCSEEEFKNLSVEALRVKAAQFARRAFYSLRCHNRRVQSLDEMSKNGTAPFAQEPVSRKPGQGELLLGADFMRRLLAPLAEFSQDQQTLFLERALRRRRFVDLEKETGRSAEALTKSYLNILRRLRARLQEKGITMAEVEEELSRHDREEAV